MDKINVYQVLTHADQPVGSRWVHMWANVREHYWSHSNGICNQRVTHTPKFMQTHSQIVCITIMAKDE